MSIFGRLMPRPNWILLCFAGAVLVALVDPRGHAWLAVGGLLVWAAGAIVIAWGLRRSAMVPVAVLTAGVGLRLLTLLVEPQYSDDLFRYLWEGRVQLAGLNPFLYPPDDPALAHLRDDTWASVNHRSVSTIYPPGALLLFRGVSATLYAPLGWKLLAAAADIGVLLLLVVIVRDRGGRAWAPAVYALHPMPILESAGSGHLESVALLGLTAAVLLWDRGRPAAALLAATGGALIKLLPAVAAIPALRELVTTPEVPERRRIAAALAAALGVTAALSLPFLDAGLTVGRGFNTYYDAWAYNASLFPLLLKLVGDPGVARAIGVVIGAALCAHAAWRLRDPARLALFVAACLILLSPVVHPWYMLWALVPALAVGAWPWVVLATTALLSYLVLGTYSPATHSWSEPAWIPWVEYPPLMLAVLWCWLTRWRPWTPPPSPQRPPSP